ncbi:MAG: hypothetical protein A2X61_16995 [Ignavibacteria bacterium GWB2_35_12]|nr:MAG: hypothetical protein A2X61_16995 [Ignavibacteria bacterium GWB2_35_12]OGU87484.1 MAG: hypothetical protein A2220_17030 [Ignavibacteria bacterium RIFOXYA2_FULL_35_10]OGV25030.1 MAG: hypothetical protein A2475_16630 [Ignavibacteria bacterium RIFOXYC2_FULL_35_21]
MKKRTAFVLGLTILFSLVLLNLPVFAKIQSNSVIEKDGSILLPSQKSTTHAVSNFTQAPLRSPEWKAFFNANGKWTVLIDKTTLTPHRAFGKPVQIKNINNITNDNVQSASMQFLRDNSKLLNINPDELKLTKTKKVNKLWYVGYKQAYKGIEVLLSEVELRIREDGKVIAFGVEYYNNINVNITPTIPLATAMSNASEGLKFDSKRDVTQSEGRMFILPVKNNGKVKFSLVYDINVETRQPIGKFSSFVDAHSGYVIWRLNKIHDVNTTVNTKGYIKEKYSYDTAKQMPFPHQYFNIGTERNESDKNGSWTKDISSQKSIIAKMEGPWAKVQYILFPIQTSSDSAYFEGSLIPGSNFVLNWNDNYSTLQERMLFYHTNYIHDYLKNLDSAFDGMDFQVILTIIPDFYYFNAGSDGRDITFYGTDSPPNHFAESPSILYHEYTHSVNAQLYLQFGGTPPLGMVNGSTHEATADLGAAFMYDDHIIGKGAYEGDTNQNVRDIDNNNIYPDSIDGEPHHDGMILSGAFWDFRKLTSREIAEKVSHFSKYGTPDDPDVGIAFSEWFIEAILTDDNFGTGDNDPSNGTPHLMELVTAFNEHQIGTDLLLAFSYAHTPLPDTKNIVDPYIVECNLNSEPNILNSHPDSVYVIYTTNNFESMNMVPAIQEPTDQNKYKAEIPALPNGTSVKYYIQAKESVSGRTLKFTGAYPDFEPYQFLVGYETLYLEDFELENNWTVDNQGNSSPNGKWERDVPQEVEYNWNASIWVLQPGEDHTPGGTRCYVTGHLAIPGDIFSYMPDGTTTLISGLYDLSEVNNSVIRFYHYFTCKSYWSESPGNESKLIFEVSSNGGTSWVSVDTITQSTWEWKKSQYDISDYLNTTDRMRFRFIVKTFNNELGFLAYLTEGLIDDFEILVPGDIAPPTIIADFAGTPTTGVAPLSVHFSDSSKGAVSTWWWDFGDGINSTEKNPIHQYTTKGSYNVSLTISDGVNQDTKWKNNYITVIPMKADFTAKPLEGIMPLEVQFTDKSQGTVSSWFWDFGEGGTSTEQNPTYTFVDEGSYSVVLVVKHSDDSSEVIKDDYISVYKAFGASFTADTNSGVIPLTVHFTDQSFGNPTSWIWDFGDGGTSTEQNPSHVYTTQGIYNVSLTVSDGTKQSTKTKTDFISAYHSTAVDDESNGLVGLNVYPNPFSSSTAIYYELKSPAYVSLKIYDLMGNLVSSLVDESQSDGGRVSVWNGTKPDGTKANTGMYFYRLQAGSKTFTGKLILY